MGKRMQESEEVSDQSQRTDRIFQEGAAVGSVCGTEERDKGREERQRAQRGVGILRSLPCGSGCDHRREERKGEIRNVV